MRQPLWQLLNSCLLIFLLRPIKRSLIEVELVGRFQQLKGNQLEKLAEHLNVSYSQLPKVIIDVGHNPHAAKYLAEKLTVLKTQNFRLHYCCLWYVER